MERKYLTAALRDARLGCIFLFLAESPIILFCVEMRCYPLIQFIETC